MRELQQLLSPSAPSGLDSPAGPTIETARLRLRLHRPADLEARIAMTGDPQFMRFVGGVYDRQENWARILRYVGHWAVFGYGLFAVEERETGRYVGDVGLAHFERGIGEDFDPYPEGAWMIAEWASGLGYASEGLSAAIGWHEQNAGHARQVCIIDPANEASLRVAAKVGFRVFREGVNRGHGVLVLERVSSVPLRAEPITL